jgi:hypothetical protein
MRRKTYRRREVLKIGATGLSAGVILTLAAGEAKAGGSWQTLHPGQARAKGSWQRGDGRVIDRHLQDVEPEGAKNGFVVPGSYEWRLERDAQKSAEDEMLGDFKRFGHEN